ncbi:glycine--tRNA ligase [bacterium]|uniref:glycine--tRNA ligase n=2 Tax=Katanobacteria TaxID=422282 RepID=A0A2M7X3S0_UNCKA|nr:glycine--tRNA ligase [bacterium]PIP56401.1 MAG: glycine--tRNA ligase [candidate division WWE3 bacterium CG22_combo_CG10-13_8_21_14_all_39_12]PJA40790.1 MAG: glycine--tRNA ligase [candidate division WWE3 bacterium CG_4_9_14_3_um_filter_39_7]
MSNHDIQDVVSLAKRRGFVFPSSQIYGGWEATYDFGPLGTEILRTLKNLWWENFIHRKPNVVGLDSAIISHPRVWEASGHVDSFADVMVEDKKTQKRYRADHLIEDTLNIPTDGFTPQEFDELIGKNNIKSPDNNELSQAKYFNQLVEVQIGTTSDTKSTAYLRGETCQPIFYNYGLVKDSMRMKLPFGVGQIGKAFRNEIKVGPFFFRTREFEQMEIEMFLHPSEASEQLETFKTESMEWLTSLGISKDKLKFREQEFKERAHYNKIATDIEYSFPFGWKEFQGIHYRGDWDLTRHGEFSGHSFVEKIEETGEEFVPHIVEYSIGLSRLLLVLLSDAYTKEEDRLVLKIASHLAPYKAAVFPLVRNKPEITERAKKIFADLNLHTPTAFDDRGNIGKRYLSQDEIGTPFCVTIDYDTLDDGTVTVRDRDSKEQIRIAETKLVDYILTNTSV